MNNDVKIYDDIVENLNQIENELGKSFENKELENAINVARENFSNWRASAENELVMLKNSVEWDKLTIAFYGETNAGKSTIIETLRILFEEPTKSNQQKKFLSFIKKHNISKEELENQESLIAEIDLINDKIAKLEEANLVKINDLDSIIAERKNQKNQLILIIKEYSLLKKIISFFAPQDEVREKKEITNSIRLLEDDKKLILSKTKNEKRNFENEITIITSKVKSIESLLTELKQYQDGEIIGDGRSDFTRESTIYNFTLGKGQLQLIDVPGIEGKEELVQDAIMDAVKKAHMVFYVTRKADPPQKGDDKTGVKGTLERIQEHLSAQTEVWTIFNKSIKSPKALVKSEFLTSDEENSLNVLDKEMKKQLNENYQGRIELSAYPAFLSSTSNFIPTSDNFKNRVKFLSEFDEKQLFNKVQFNILAQKIEDEAKGNFAKKIKKSNFNKALHEVNKLINIIDIEVEKNLKPLSVNSKKQIENSKNQIVKVSKKLHAGIRSEYESAIERFSQSIKKQTYDKINTNIKNDEFKDYLRKKMEDESIILDENLNQIKNDKIVLFEKEIMRILDKNEEMLNKLISLSGVDKNINLDDVEIKNNIDWGGILAGIGNGVLAAFFTGGVGLILNLFGAIIGLAKAAWSFFDSEYKMSEQKNNTNKVLAKHAEKLKVDLEKDLYLLEKNINEQTNEIIKSLDIPLHNFNHIIKCLNNSKELLKQKSFYITNEGDL